MAHGGRSRSDAGPGRRRRRRFEVSAALDDPRYGTGGCRAFTGRADYEGMLRRVFATCPTHLVAGARSRASWDVPCWAIDAAATCYDITDSGHMMMLEQPHRLATLLSQLVCQGQRQDG
jgi:pimeloyl-ACP methyl ester carboxylesterase